MPDPQPAWLLDHRQATAARIVRRREAAGITQQGLINATGLERSTIQRIEYAEVDPRLSSLALIAHAIGVPVGDLIADLPE